MGKTSRKCVAVFFMAVVFFAANNVFGADTVSSGSLIPETLVIADAFEPGIGEPVGKVLMVDGEAVIIHSDVSRAYRVRKDLPLYNKDTVITGAKARLRITLNDGSMTTLASDTKLTINRSAYDPDKENRSAFLGMESGKARFWAVKMKDFKNSEFKVKTKTAVAGVRGSDFVITATDVATEVITLKDTLLEVFSLADPEAEPVLLSDFMRSQVGEGKLPTIPEKVQMEDIERLMREFLFSGETYDADRMIRLETPPDEDEEKQEDLSTGEQEGALAELVQKGILLSDEEIYRPDLTDMQRMLQDFRLFDMIRPREFSRMEEDTRNRQSDFSQVIRENESASPDAQEYDQLPGPVEGP